MVATTKIQKVKCKDEKEGDHFFHSHMWVNGLSVQFIVDNGSQKNLILAKVIKGLKF